MNNKNLKIFSSLLLIAFLVATMIGCKKEKNGQSNLIELLSFGPTGARHGDTLRFIGNNLDKVTSIEFTGGAAAEITQVDFKIQTSELILVIVPQAAEKGYVTLKTPQGDIITKTQLNLDVTTTVTSFTNQARPGANVTISGAYLNWVQKVVFANDKEVTSFVSKAFDQLVVTVPDDAETGPLLIFYGGTDSSDFQTDDTLRVTLPVATSLAPNPILHQTDLTITGTDLDLAKKIIFTGVSTPVTSFISQTATQLVLKVPAGTKKGKIKLVAASEVSTDSPTDLDLILPSVATMTPNPVDPGTDLTITGTNLDLVTSITFENAAPVTSFVSQTATQIVVTVPMGILRGNITLGVLNSTVTVQSADVLEVLGSAPPPVVALPFYNDAVTSNWTSTGWIGGGWGGAADYNNTSPVREGTKSIKIDYVGGYGSPLQLGGANIDMTPYTTFKLSVYGAPGSGGKTVTVGINGTNGQFNFNVVEGVWTDYAIPISTLTASSTMSEIWIQEFSGTGGFTIYVDAMGLN